MPTTITGTDGVSQVQTGAVESGDLPAGSVIQVVSDTQVSDVISSSTTYVAQGLQVSLTPASTTNKIVLILNNAFDTAGNKIEWTFFRSIDGSSDTNIFANDDQLNIAQGSTRGVTGTCAIDSPNTTSEVTYKLFFRSGIGGTVEFPSFSDMHQFLVAMEIAG